MNLFKSTKATTYISSRGDKVYPIIMDIKTGIVEGDAVFTTGDIDTAYLYTTILEEQSDYNILGSTVICNIQRPDGTTMKVQGDVLGNNLIEFPLGQSGVSQEGIYNFDIAVVFSEKKMVTSPTAQYSVTQSIEVIGEIEEDDRFPVLESLISGINVINEEELVRVSNEEVRQSKEEAREQAESVRVRNEEVRLANNEAIRNEEAVRVTNENERKNAESLRVQEENKRKQQENTRIAQENTRVSQETARVNEENVRKNQEATRQANEATRVSQETNRSQAESTRNSNETVRQNQENARKSQEQARVTAEGNRVTSENVRVSAEQARVLKEQERQAIEVERQNSESTREQQEATRVSQENARKQADILRQQEHESRQQFLNGFEGKLNTVVDDVAGIKDDVVSVKEANKRQDVFLQGLYNENLDGRVTVKEEGSVISLTNSDNGLVDVVGLEGNTMVNYVTDGAKELTLNGDIDVEGTNVTLTEGVDNGLIDVMCEGNTLVNVLGDGFSNPSINKTNEVWTDYPLEFNNEWLTVYSIGQWSGIYRNATTMPLLKPSTQYTLIVEVKENTLSIPYQVLHASNNIFTAYNTSIKAGFTGIKRFLFTTQSDLSGKRLMQVMSGSLSTNTTDKITYRQILLEGDWTNKEIPEYFEGMKSVGECEGNKIEILSQNKNFLINGFVSGNIDSNGVLFNQVSYLRSLDYEHCIPNTEIIASYNSLFRFSQFFFFDKDKIFIDRKTEIRATVPNNAKYFKLVLAKKDGTEVTSGDINSYANKTTMVRLSNQTDVYVEPKLNKKEISLNEPLRALPNGVKDKIVKIGSKHYVERNCGNIRLDGSEGWTTTGANIPFGMLRIPLKPNGNISDTSQGALCDRLIITNIVSNSVSDNNKGVYLVGSGTNSHIRIRITDEDTKDSIKQWLSQNPTTVVYQLATPIYEELPIEPILNTYTDVTHISNNSTIPCNMTVKNTGYNAIIKPSTQYTVAFDTDKSGEVGINLGGSKVTTTNNVATINTPSTLTDDSLRLTGKGIKASKVRLLEGDKTNWIPSYFEGMQSSFEDNKVEIVVSNNGNIYDGKYNKDTYINGYGTVSESLDWCSTDYLEVTPNTLYTQNYPHSISSITHCAFYDKDKEFISVSAGDVSSYITPNNCKYIRTCWRYSTNGLDGFIIQKGNVANVLEPYQSNKLEIMLNEPLRGIGDVKDRFVFKDGKLMIERNCHEFIFNGSEYWVDSYQNFEKYYVMRLNPATQFVSAWSNTKNMKSSYLPSVGSYMYSESDIEKYHRGISSDNNNTIMIGVPKYIFSNVNDGKQYLANNPINVVVQRKEPTYEEIPLEVQKLILEGYVNGTLFLDTNIPPTVEVSYTANIPVVSELNKNSNEIIVTQEDLSVTQVAVDFLLMSNLGEEMLSSFNINTRGRNSMGAYFANRIMKGALKYEDVISKYPQYKEEIDSILETK